MRFLKSKYILRKKEDISSLLKNTKWMYTKDLKIYYKNNQLGYIRFIAIASKSWGKSNKRNRFKRLVRESMRELLNQFDLSIDLAILPNKNLKSEEIKKIKKNNIQVQLLSILKKLNRED